ncbi:HAMP domain-containing sensor histidine kinase [Paenibacillus sp. NEAU-GSW1]|uniref:sensor histidine kinase n=1 Tax=Paenibacillus sp. NEAU-GSW1 TaxID=2682486 RepID=UPI0012E26DDF|nr:HAMP domain-containing sensor histidine kinase [Paenibacillus sp. NEAU-GSW1]MUT68851.1 HAMP domain-containing protein [Paenibacillus sp. NEAU-GSW1]
MSIRFRLLFSFTSVVVISVALVMLAAYLLSVAATGDYKSVRSFYTIHYSLHPLSEEEESIFLDLKYLAKNDPAKLEDLSLLEDYDQKLKMVQAGLLVRKGDELLYTTLNMNETKFELSLPKYEMGNYSIRNTMNVGSRFFAYAKFDFYFDTDSEEKGSIFVVRERSPFAEIIRRMLPMLIGLFALIVLITSFILYRYVTHKIVLPLEGLRKSAERIKDGDLNDELKPNSKDEIGQLTMSFEEMRRQLRASIQLQLQYEENRKRLLSNISHDLRTPITTIKGYAEGIRDGVARTPEKLDQYAGAIHTRASDMERLVEELFYYSKLDLKEEPFRFDEVDAVSLIQKFVDEHALDFEREGIQLKWVGLPEQALSIQADQEKLKRVVRNLLVNSIKFMKMDPKIITVGIRAEETNGEVEVIIADNGPGIGAESLPLVFDRFYRADDARSPSTGGSGLGLAIAKQIIEGHGGTITAKSEEGHGTEIHFTLPIIRKSR